MLVGVALIVLPTMVVGNELLILGVVSDQSSVAKGTVISGR